MAKSRRTLFFIIALHYHEMFYRLLRCIACEPNCEYMHMRYVNNFVTDSNFNTMTSQNITYGLVSFFKAWIIVYFLLYLFIYIFKTIWRRFKGYHFKSQYYMNFGFIKIFSLHPGHVINCVSNFFVSILLEQIGH